MTKKINLFCLPFAGGNKYSYRDFELKAPSFLNIISLEYPGRGTRMNEPLVCDMNILVDDLYEGIRNKTDDAEFAIYGHSMGGLIAYLLTLKLLSNNHPSPSHLFITGTMGPSAAARYNNKKHLLGKKEFIDEIKKLDGCPPGILENDDLLEYFEPILRNDFQVTETFRYKEAGPLNIPFTVITGTEEEMAESDIQLWQKESSIKVDFRVMPGKHFFIFKYSLEIIEIIAKKLLTPVKHMSYE